MDPSKLGSLAAMSVPVPAQSDGLETTTSRLPVSHDGGGETPQNLDTPVAAAAAAAPEEAEGPKFIFSLQDEDQYRIGTLLRQERHCDVYAVALMYLHGKEWRPTRNLEARVYTMDGIDKKLAKYRRRCVARLAGRTIMRTVLDESQTPTKWLIVYRTDGNDGGDDAGVKGAGEEGEESEGNEANGRTLSVDDNHDPGTIVTVDGGDGGSNVAAGAENILRNRPRAPNNTIDMTGPWEVDIWAPLMQQPAKGMAGETKRLKQWRRRVRKREAKRMQRTLEEASEKYRLQEAAKAENEANSSKSSGSEDNDSASSVSTDPYEALENRVESIVWALRVSESRRECEKIRANELGKIYLSYPRFRRVIYALKNATVAEGESWMDQIAEQFRILVADRHIHWV